MSDLRPFGLCAVDVDAGCSSDAAYIFTIARPPGSPLIGCGSTLDVPCIRGSTYRCILTHESRLGPKLELRSPSDVSEFHALPCDAQAASVASSKAISQYPMPEIMLQATTIRANCQQMIYWAKWQFSIVRRFTCQKLISVTLQVQAL